MKSIAPELLPEPLTAAVSLLAATHRPTAIPGAWTPSRPRTPTFLATSPLAPFGERIALVKMKANPVGAAQGSYLLLTSVEGDLPVLVPTSQLAR